MSFAPYKDNYRAALKYLGLGVLFGGFSAVSEWGSPGQLAFGVAAGICVIMAVSEFRIASNRKFGLDFERWHRQSASKYLEKKQYLVEENRRLPTGGDVDMIIYDRNKAASVTVEIKSFRKWKGWWRFGGMKREKLTFSQAKLQARLMRSRAAIIWLPQGQPTFLQVLFPPRDGVARVVFGGPGKLKREAQKHLTRAEPGRCAQS